MRLNDREQAILSAVEHNALMTVRDLARHCGMQEHTARYVLKSLEERGVLKIAPFISGARLGLQNVGIFFSPQHRAGAHVSTASSGLHEAILACPEVVWWAELGGAYRFGLALAVRSFVEVQAFLERVAGTYPDLIGDKCLSVELSHYHFGRKYLGGAPSVISSSLAAGDAVILDQLDKDILLAMEHQQVIGKRELSRHLGAPLTTIDRRLSLLRERGVMLGIGYHITARAFGMQQFTLLASSRGYQSLPQSRLLQYIAAHPNIIEAYCGLGNWDYEFNVEVSDPRLVPSLTEQLIEAFPNYLTSIHVVQRFVEHRCRTLPGSL